MVLDLGKPAWQLGLRWQATMMAVRRLPFRLAMASYDPKDLKDRHHLNGHAVSQDELATQTFYELFARYQKPIADFLYRMTHDREMAADLTQDTFLKAFAHIDDLPSITNVRAWLYRIAANTASNALRHQRRFAWLSLADLPPGDSSEAEPGVVLAAQGDLATSVVERDELERAMLTLSATARAVLLLRATAGFETAEIATMLRLSEANVRKILYRAKEKMRQMLSSPTPELEKETP